MNPNVQQDFQICISVPLIGYTNITTFQDGRYDPEMLSDNST